MKPTSVLSLALLAATAVFAQTNGVTLNTTPSRAVGQPSQLPVTLPESGAPNLIEGRELFAPQSVALDTSVTPPILYVSDTGNNRVLAWKNATGFTTGQHADLVIGQPDFYSTAPQGPGQTYSTGLTQPTGVVVDSNGNLYVADSGNNRVLRYPKPFQQNQFPLTPNLIIGQPTLNSRTANFAGGVSDQGLVLSTTNSLYQCFMAFDASGNLWLSDAGNNRVLRFPNVANQNGGGIHADIVIGQATTNSTFSPTLTATPAGANTTNQLLLPSAVAFDSAGRLYIADGLNRILVFKNPAASPGNASADSLLGVYPLGTQPTSQTQVGTTEMHSPSSIFFFPDQSVGVVDSGFNRILIFPPFSQWTQTPQQAIQPGGVVGQSLDFTSVNANGSRLTAFTGLSTPPPSNQTFWSPTTAVLLPGTNPTLFVSDTSNNRVLRMPIVNPNPGSGNGGTSTSIVGPANGILGQDLADQYSINLIEGREFSFDFQSGTQLVVDAGIALDTSGSVPHLYVADPYNHRVLGFADARRITAGATADIVIGQPDKSHALCNYPSGDPNQPTASSLCRPVAVLVDPQGNLYVSDSGNGRVLRFPAPFNNKGALESADLVLGQRDFQTVVQDPGPGTMKSPYGLAFTGSNGLLVADQSFNRVLYFKFTANNTFSAGADNGLTATKVFGQPNFTTITTGTGIAAMNAPHHISTDADGLVYVADSGNNRVLVFQDPANVQTQSAGAASSLQLPITVPRGIYVSPTTGEIWVTSGATVTRYPKYQTLILNPAATGQVVDAVGTAGLATLAVTQDQYGDLFVADQYNRVVAYFQGLTSLNAASLITVNPTMAPGVIASLFPLASASQFGTKTEAWDGKTFPLPTTLGDVQVTVNGTPAPLYFVSPGQINIVFPQNAPSSGTAEVEVNQVSTGQILGAFQVPMQSYAPGIFICPSTTGTPRAACVINQDNTVNSASNPAPRGSVISIYATGQGVVPNAPADGMPATGAISTSNTPVVVVGLPVDQYTPQPGEPLDNCPHFICYSGLNGYPGMWQVNVEIPKGVPPSTTAPVILDLILQGVPAWAVTTSPFKVIVYVSQ